MTERKRILEAIQSEKDVVQHFTDFVDNHIQIVRVGVGLLGLTGVMLIGRSVRLMKTFYSVSDIPEDFIRKQMTLRGKVKGHRDDHLLVEHLPIMRPKWLIRNKTKESSLPVHLAGVSLSEDVARQRLQVVVPTDSLIWFKLLAVNETQGLDCIVTKKKNLVWSVMVNKLLVKEGHACIKPITISETSTATATKLSQRLVRAEAYAERKGRGMWAKPSMSERVREQGDALRSKARDGMDVVLKPFRIAGGTMKSLGIKITGIFKRSGKSMR